MLGLIRAILIIKYTVSITSNSLNRIEDKVLMNLSINKINVNNKIYEKDSALNHIDKNVFILKESDYPDKNKGIVLLGAHSGTGEIAYFKNLNRISESDIIEIDYNKKKYRYRVINKYLDEKKDGISVNYNVKKNRLVLYTCNPKDKSNYLVIVSELI